MHWPKHPLGAMLAVWLEYIHIPWLDYTNRVWGNYTKEGSRLTVRILQLRTRLNMLRQSSGE